MGIAEVAGFGSLCFTFIALDGLLEKRGYGEHCLKLKVVAVLLGIGILYHYARIDLAEMVSVFGLS